jgi:hypothetical protein
MNREKPIRNTGPQSEEGGGQQEPDIKQLQQRLERIEQAVEAITDGLGWSLCGRCTRCEDGWLIREQTTTRCTSCNYRSE